VSFCISGAVNVVYSKSCIKEQCECVIRSVYFLDIYSDKQVEHESNIAYSNI
jgi:hypothetical protein